MAPVHAGQHRETTRWGVTRSGVTLCLFFHDSEASTSSTAEMLHSMERIRSSRHDLAAMSRLQSNLLGY